MNIHFVPLYELIVLFSIDSITELGLFLRPKTYNPLGFIEKIYSHIDANYRRMGDNNNVLC